MRQMIGVGVGDPAAPGMGLAGIAGFCACVKLESPELSSKRLARLGARTNIFLLLATR